MRHITRIRMLNLGEPSASLMDDELQFFSSCFGMFNNRDREKSCFRIFVHLLKGEEALSSEELAEKSNLSRATVIHHLSKLSDSGFISKDGNSYLLKHRKLEDLTREIEKDVLLTFEKLKIMSRRIDEELGR